MLRRSLLVSLGLLVVAATTHAATIDIVRDKWGVAHIFTPATLGNTAAQLKAGAFAQGYVTAQDRMVQLEFFRRAGEGRLSEVAGIGGASNLPMDIAARRDGLTTAERQALINKLPKNSRIATQAFADGINKFLAEIAADPSKAPAEFALIGVTPEPWATTDTAAIAELEVRRFGQNGGGEIGNAALLLDLMDKFPADAQGKFTAAQGIFNDLFWLEDPTAPTTIDPTEQTFKPDKFTGAFSQLQMDLITAHAAAIRGMLTSVDAEHASIMRISRRIGLPLTFPHHSSNAMVVSGALAANGVPILLGGPQTGMSVPSFFHEIGLHQGSGAGSYDAEGVTVPGGSGLVIGRTATAAWSITSGITDNTDVYIETLNPANPKQYKFGKGFKDMSCRPETFNVAGQTPETHEFCRTKHGPVFASYPSDNVAFSQKIYMFGHELNEGEALLSLGFSKSLKQFQSTINKLDASLNCMYADNANGTGNIAYFHRGVRPHRPTNLDPRLPLPGTGEGEPKGMLTGGKMPTIINPKLGYIAQWNNKPIKGWSADEQRELWGGADRVQILLDQLAAAKAANHPISTDDLGNYMKLAATTDFFAAKVFPYLQAAVTGLPGSTSDLAPLQAATGLISTWLGSGGGTLLADNSGNIPYPGVTIYRAWRQQVQTDTFGDELGGHNDIMRYFAASASGNNQDDSGELGSPDALFLRALAGGTAAPFPTSRDYFQNVTTSTNPGRDATLVGSLRTAIATLTAQYGTATMSQWLTPKITVTFSAESAASVSMERENRGTFNEIIELSSTPTGQIIVPPGNSGFIAPGLIESPHLRDQLPLYEAFQYKKMPFALSDLEGPTTTETLTLP